jgi:hypothetical protein
MAADAAFLQGALTKLDAILAKLKGTPETFPAMASKVGDRWAEAAEAPGFFERGRRFATTDAGLADQFGIGQKQTVLDPDNAKLFGEVQWPTKAGFLPPNDAHKGLYEKNRGYQDLISNASGAILGAKNAGLLPKNANYRLFDTITLDAGSGAGTKLYPAAYGSLLQHPDTYNVVDALSAENSIRRNFNQASAGLRDPELTKRILTTTTQLRHVPTDLAEVHKMAPTQQIGALQLAGSAGTLASLRSQLDYGIKKLARGSDMYTPQRAELEFNLEQLAHRIRRLDGTQGALSSLSNGVQRFGNTHAITPFGDRTARRVGLTLRALEGDRNFSDITRGLEYCAGGLVDR